jgi:pyruvate kinase
MRAMVEAGMDVARINFSHGDHAAHAQAIADLRRIADESDRLLAIMADLQGTKLRVGKLSEQGVMLQRGDSVTLADEPFSGRILPLSYPEVLAGLNEGQRVLLDDGRMEFVVESEKAGRVTCRVVTGGRLTSNKGVHLPGVRIFTFRVSELGVQG